MYIKNAVKYALSENRKAMLWFYGIIVFLTVALYTILKLTIDGEIGGSSNMDSSSVIFILIAGITSFAGTFQFFLQNGVTRKTYFLSAALTFLTMALIMTIADMLIGAVSVAIFTSSNMTMTGSSLFQLLYRDWLAGKAAAAVYLTEILVRTAVYFLMGMVGIFFGALFYRIGKLLRVLISAGVPVLLFIVLPIIDTTLTNGKIFGAIADFFVFVTGFQNGGNPFIFAGFSLLGAAIAGALIWLLVRRATAKA